jgi:hypothetical protein
MNNNEIIDNSEIIDTKVKDYENLYLKMRKLYFSKSQIENFEIIQSLILRKSLIKLTEDFLHKSIIYIGNNFGLFDENYSINNKISRIFLIYVLILFHRKNVLGDINLENNENNNENNENNNENNENNNLEKLLFESAKELHLSVVDLHKNYLNKFVIIKFHQKLKKYVLNFEAWKTSDKDSLVENLTYNYWELEVVARQDFSLQDDGGESIIEFVKLQQQKILESIKKIDGNDGLQKFNEYVPIIYNDNFLENIREVLETAYWDIIKEELLNESNTTKLKYVFEEVKDLLLNLVGNNEDYINRIDNNFDIDFIISLIDNKSMGLVELNQFITQLLSFIKELDSEINDESNDIFINNYLKFTTNIIQIEDNEYNQVIESLIYALEYILPKCKDIYDTKEITTEILNDMMDLQ